MSDKIFVEETKIGNFHFPMPISEAGKGLRLPTLVELGSLLKILEPKEHLSAYTRTKALKIPKIQAITDMLEKGFVVGNTIRRGIPKNKSKCSDLTSALTSQLTQWAQDEMKQKDGLIVFDSSTQNSRLVAFDDYLKQVVQVQRYANMGQLGSLSDPPTAIKLISSLIPDNSAIEAYFFFSLELYRSSYALWAAMPEAYGHFNVYLQLKMGEPFPNAKDKPDIRHLLIRPGAAPKAENETILFEG